MTLAESIQRHRRAAGLSQDQLAHRAGLSRSHVQDIERQRRPSITLITLAKIAAATDCTPADLLTDVELGQGVQ